jgi:hypothetical protein
MSERSTRMTDAVPYSTPSAGRRRRADAGRPHPAGPQRRALSRTGSAVDPRSGLSRPLPHVNIALLNELATFGDSVDIDSWGAIDAVSSKSFGYVRFTPGPGVGGHFLPIDPSYLAGLV